MASSYIVIAKRIEQAKSVSQYAGGASMHFNFVTQDVDKLLAIQQEWSADETIDVQDKSTLDAIFVTYRPQIVALLAKIDAGIAAATTLEETSSEE